MVLLTLEISGNATSSPRHTFTLDHPLSYSKATLVGIDLHAPSPGLSQSWTSAQTGDDYPQNRTAYAPLYVDIEGIAGPVPFVRDHYGNIFRVPRIVSSLHRFQPRIRLEIVPVVKPFYW